MSTLLFNYIYDVVLDKHSVERVDRITTTYQFHAQGVSAQNKSYQGQRSNASFTTTPLEMYLIATGH